MCQDKVGGDGLSGQFSGLLARVDDVGVYDFGQKFERGGVKSPLYKKMYIYIYIYMFLGFYIERGCRITALIGLFVSISHLFVEPKIKRKIT